MTDAAQLLIILAVVFCAVVAFIGYAAVVVGSRSDRDRWDE